MFSPTQIHPSIRSPPMLTFLSTIKDGETMEIMATISTSPPKSARTIFFDTKVTPFPSTFTYNGGEVFSFSGDDDVYVYINRNLAIDLGGVHGPEQLSVNLDTLGLTIGQDYSLDVFQAERHTVGSTFRMDTTLQLVATPPDDSNNGRTFVF
jgi:fibro-slime domain-containing protein